MTAALLLLDLQVATLTGLGADASGLVARVRGLLDTARAAARPVVHTSVAFAAGYPGVPPEHRVFGRVRAAGALLADDPATAIHPELAPAPGEIVIVKTRVSGFCGTSLDEQLRARGVDRVVLAGVITSGAVLSTAREAADRDYDVVVAADGCADPDPELHRFLLDRLLVRQAEVVDVATAAERLRHPEP